MGNAIYKLGGKGGWSLNTNPTNNWSYGYKNTKFSDFILFPDKSYRGWWYNEPSVSEGDTANIWKNYDSYSQYRVSPNQISIHPSRNGKWTVVRWTAPKSGSLRVIGFFGAGDSGVMTYSVLHNNSTELFIKSLVNTTESFDFSVMVTTGDVLDFQIGEGWNNGNTPIDIKIGDDYFNEETAGKTRIRNLRHKTEVFNRTRSLKHKDIDDWKRVNL